jgi:ketosteroid isomerase-like protein
MGFESVELVRRVYLAWQAGDLEELLSFVDPEVSWSPVLRFLEGERAAVGHQELRRWFRHIRIAYRSLRPLPERFEDHGSRVLVLGRLVGAGRLEEGDLDVPVSWVWTVRAGRIVAMQAFLDERAARDALADGGGGGVSTPVAGD